MAAEDAVTSNLSIASNSSSSAAEAVKGVQIAVTILIFLVRSLSASFVSFKITWSETSQMVCVVSVHTSITCIYKLNQSLRAPLSLQFTKNTIRGFSMGERGVPPLSCYFRYLSKLLKHLLYPLLGLHD